MPECTGKTDEFEHGAIMNLINNIKVISEQCDLINQKIDALKALQKLITKDMAGLDHLLAPQIDGIFEANNAIRLAHESITEFIGAKA